MDNEAPKRKPKVIMLSGLPAAGKTTRAKEIVQSASVKTVRVTKDLLRSMLHFNLWNGKNEMVTFDAEKDLVRSLLRRRVDVVIDDTNLAQRHQDAWKGIAVESEADFQHVHIGTPWDECVRRDAGGSRDVAVGRWVIVNMALEHNLYTPRPEKPIVICDLDGTLADTAWRVRFIKGENKDWKSFFAGIRYDPPREEIKKQLLEYHQKGHPIVFMTGRPEIYIKETEEWLEEFWPHQYLTLIMRKENDFRKDTEVKRELYKRYLSQYPVEVAIDDRPSVIRMWRELGMTVIDVGNGEEF